MGAGMYSTYFTKLFSPTVGGTTFSKGQTYPLPTRRSARTLPNPGFVMSEEEGKTG